MSAPGTSYNCAASPGCNGAAPYFQPAEQRIVPRDGRPPERAEEPAPPVQERRTPQPLPH